MQYIQFQPQTIASIPSASVGTINLFVDSATNALTVKDENGAELSTANTASYSIYSENANYATSAGSAGTATNADTASYVDGFIFNENNNALSASYAVSASYLIGYISPFPFTGSAEISGSVLVTGSIIATEGFTGSIEGSSSYATTSSYASSASYFIGNVSAFPFTGSAEISGSLLVDGFVLLTQVSASLNFVDDTSAAAGGVPLGGLYRNGNFIVIRLA